MKLTVEMHRQTKYEPDAGSIRAYVIQGGIRGSNLMEKHYASDVAYAVEVIRERIGRQFQAALCGVPDLVFCGDDERLAEEIATIFRSRFEVTERA